MVTTPRLAARRAGQRMWSTASDASCRATDTVERALHRAPDEDRDVAATPRRLRDLDRRQKVWLVLLGALLAATGARVVSDLRDRDAVVVGDEALIALFAHDAPDTVPLIGKVTSAGLYGNLPTPHNPGPLESWTLSPFVLVLGTSTGAWIYAYVVNVGCALLAAWAGFRRGGPRLGVIILVTCLAMFEVTAPGGISSVLNTRIVLMPLFATMVVAAAVVLGDTALLAVLVLLASYVVQTHIGYALVPAAALLTVASVLAWRRHRGITQDRLGRHLLWAGAVALVCWVPPLLDQLFGQANLQALLSADVPRGGIGKAVDAFGSMLNPTLVFFEEGELSSTSYEWPSPVLAAPLLFLLQWFVLRHGRRIARRRVLLVLAGACLAAATLTAGLTPPSDTGGEHFYWLRAVSWFLVLTLALMLIPQRVGPRSPTRRRLGTIAAALVVVAAAVPMWAPKEFTEPDALTMAAVRDLLPVALDAADGDEPVAIAHQGYWPAISVSDGLITELTDRGVPVLQVDNTVIDPEATTLVVTQGPHGGGVPLAASGPEVSERERAENARVPADVVDWVRAHGPLTLAGPGVLDLAAVLDGTAPTVCIDRYRDDPSLLLDLDPEIVTELYFQQQIRSPQLPPALLGPLERWALAHPTEIRLAPPPGDGRGEELDGLVFSRPDC